MKFTYLRQLEAEAIHIMREVVAEFANPVMLYSVGKDSSVMLHLAKKAFYPSRIPFPLLHMNCLWTVRNKTSIQTRELRLRSMMTAI